MVIRWIKRLSINIQKKAWESMVTFTDWDDDCEVCKEYNGPVKRYYGRKKYMTYVKVCKNCFVHNYPEMFRIYHKKWLAHSKFTQ